MYHLTLEQIYYFLVAAEERNISRAADKLYVSPSLLSKTIHRIEEIAGMQLFKRTRQGFFLTDAGKTLYQDWKKLFRDYEDSLRHIHSSSIIRLGIQNIHDPLSFLGKYLDLKQLSPWIKTDDLYGLQQGFLQRLLDVIVAQDVGMITADKATVVQVPLCQVPGQIVCRKDDPLMKYDCLKKENIDHRNIILYCSYVPFDGISVEELYGFYFQKIGLSPSEIIVRPDFSNALLDVSLQNGICFCDSIYCRQGDLPDDLTARDVEGLAQGYILYCHKRIWDNLKRYMKVSDSTFPN